MSEPSQTEAELKQWSKAPGFCREIAQSREIILNKLSEFIEGWTLPQGKSEERFALLYNSRSITDIPPLIMEEIATISIATIRRWRKAKEKQGLIGLLGKYGTQNGKARAVSFEQSAFIISHVKAKPHIRPEHVFKMICKTFETHPSRRTVYNFINRWKQNNPALFALIENPCRWKNSFMPAFGDASADVPHFGHTWESDGTKANILITYDKKRVACVADVDVYSRRGTILIAPTSKSIALAVCARKSMLSWGIPTRIKKDNGKDYQSLHMQAVTSAFEIETPELPKYSPEKKPHVERFLGTFATSFEELLPQFIGNSVPQRKALQARETWGSKIMEPGAVVEIPLTLEEFQALADRFIEIYENTPHSGLDGKTPLEKARESHIQPQKIRDERLLDLLLAPTGKRHVGKKGIALDGSFFVSPELIEHIGRTVEIRRDLADAGTIYIFDASGKYLCQARNEPLQGQALTDYLEAKKQHVRSLKNRVRMLDKLGLSNRTPLQILYEDEIERGESNIIPFQGSFENETVKEVRKAVADRGPEPVGGALPVKILKAVNGYDDLLNNDHLTDADLDRELEEMKRTSERRSMRIHQY